MTAPAAGWYADPAGHPDRFRWWDGAGWTQFLSHDDSVPAPDESGVGEPPTEQPAEQPPTEHQPADGSEAPLPAQSAGPTPAGQYPPGYQPRPRPARAATRQSGRRSAVGAVAVVVVLALVLGVGLVLTVGRDRTELLFPDSFPSGSPSASGSTGPLYDEATRQLTLEGLSVVMPADPYVVTAESEPLAGVVVDGARAMASVQEYDEAKDQPAWMAEVWSGKVTDDLAAEDVEQTAQAVFEQIVKGYDGNNPKVKKKTSDAFPDRYPRPAHVITADIHVDVKGFDSFDNISMMVVGDPDGGYYVWASRRADNSGSAIEDALQECIESIQVL